MKKQAVVFLDILGFKSVLESDPQGAAQLLTDYKMIFEDEMRNRTVHENDPNIAQTRRLSSMDSFQTFLPMSDSVIITSDDPSLLVSNLSTFLFDVYNFSPTSRCISEESNISFKSKISRPKTYPLLFRGGISYGEVIPYEHQATLFKGEQRKGSNIFGPAFVDAYSLAEVCPKLKGPRIRCSKSFVEVLDTNAQKYIGPLIGAENDKQVELYWPTIAFEPGNSSFCSVFDNACQFLTAFMNTPEWEHYFFFVKLLVRSALRKDPSQEEPLKNHLSEREIDRAMFF